MKKSALNTFCNILAAVCIVLLVAILLIGAVDMPVAAEGETLTKAQEFLVTIKTKTTEFMSALGITSSAAVLWLSTAIKKTTAASGAQLSAEVMEKLNAIEAKMQEIEAIEGSIDEKNQASSEAMSALLKTFILSELPASVREDLVVAQDKLKPYVKGEKSYKEAVAKKEVDTLEIATKVLDAITETTKQANAETKTETAAPSYLD